MNKSELWEDLLFEISSSKIIKLGTREEKVLLGVGNKSSEIMFIGDDPSLYENGDGMVKSGSSGDFFFKLCDLVELPAKNIYLTNIVKCNAKLSELDEDEKEFYMDILNMEIALVNPKIIVTLGLESSRFLLKDETLKMKDIRGRIFDWAGGIKLIPLYDPSFLQRDSNRQKESPRWLTWQDMKNIRQLYGEHYEK